MGNRPPLGLGPSNYLIKTQTTPEGPNPMIDPVQVWSKLSEQGSTETLERSQKKIITGVDKPLLTMI